MKTASGSLPPWSSASSRWRVAVLVSLAAILVASGILAIAKPLHAQATLPRPDHVVIVMEENHSFSDIIGSSSAPYINSLANSGALFTQSFAVSHPSEPNYQAIFSGSTQGLSDDSCPNSFSGPDLGGELINAGLSFTGYSEDLPSIGSSVCISGNYARKHSPWVNFTDVPSSDNQPFTSFPSDFNMLPTISFVIPNLQNDMHDGSIQQGDTWLQQNIDSYAQYAKANNSLLIVTWDEDDNSQNNQIPTLFVGSMVNAGQYSETINHYSILRTLEDMYGLPDANNSGNVQPITDCWQSVATPTPTPTDTPTPVPTNTPTPTPTPQPPPPGTLYRTSFEDGTTQGWSGASVDALANSTTVAFDGSRSLAMTVNTVSPDTHPLLHLDSWQAGNPAMPVVGQTITAEVFVPSGPPAVKAAMMVEDKMSHDSLLAWSQVQPLQSGSWNYIAYTIPSSISGNVVSYGVAFNFPTASSQSLTAYVDAITWNRYSFEDASAEGWNGDSVDTIDDNTTFAFDGNNSMAMTVNTVSPDTHPLLHLDSWQAGSPPMPVVGQTIAAWIYIPVGSPAVKAGIVVEDSTTHNSFIPWDQVQPLQQGVWQQVSYTVPASISVVSYGIGFNFPGSSSQSLTAYIDSINF